MKRTLHSLTSIALLAMMLPFMAQASERPIEGAVSHAVVGGDDGERIAPVLRAQRSGSVKVVIELEDVPTVVTYAAAQSRGLSAQAETQAVAQLARVEQAQQRLLQPLAAANATVIYRVQRAYNGIAVQVDASKLNELAGLPGVKAIHPLVTKHLENNGSVPLIGAPQVWQQTVGANKATGKGLRIAVIDSGIDYVHRDFGGTGDYTGITDAVKPAIFPTAKVVGGYDFVGDEYDARFAASSTPKPDANPMDCLQPNPGTVGHGTHVSGSAAGYGVNAAGSTYTGPWDTTTPFSSLRIGPGVAPEASLVALRVFGCDGSTDVTDLAIEWAVDPNADGNPADHVDVINMSLGSDYGYNYDSTSVASANAVKAGVIVVASAGNSDDTSYITGSPGSADSVISVAAANQPSSTLDGIQVVAGPAAVNNKRQPASFSVAYDWATKPDVTGAVYYPATNGTACAAYSDSEKAQISGKVVIVDWTDGACGSVARTANVVAAGGIGAILVDNSDAFDLFITGSATIPSVSMPKQIGELLKANLSGLQVKFSGTYRNSTTFSDASVSDVVASFTSRGPRRGGILKPDIAAPGVNIFSALVGSSDDGHSLNGTSMAAPHVAGVMAILKQLHPDWTVQQLKALVMNTATNDVRSAVAADSQILGPARVGAGRVNVPNAAAGSVLAFDAQRPENVSVSFGNVEVVSTTSLTRTVTVQNKGSGMAMYDLSYTPVTVISGVSYSVSPASVMLDPGQSATATVVMSANPALMKHSIDPTQSRTQAGAARQFVSDASGYLTMTAQTPTRTFTANIRGYYENPPVASDVYAVGQFTYTEATNKLDYTITFNKSITLSNLGGHIHRGPAGVNGPIAVGFAGTPSATLTTTSGSLTLSAADAVLLLNGGMYANFHTAANPGGQLRGQIVPASPALRLPIYAAARPTAQMKGALAMSKTPGSVGTPITGTIALSGIGVNGGTSLPTDTVSIVSALELQHSSPRLTAANVLTSSSDLQYVGVSSNYPTTNAVANSVLFFGVSTYSNWASINEIYVEVDFDTNGDGKADYALLSTNTGTSDANDVVLSALAKINANGSLDPNFGGAGNPFRVQYPLNIVQPSQADTHLYNSNVVVLGVKASDLGLTDAASSFSYQVFTGPNVDDGAIEDATPRLRYNVAKPGVTFNEGFLGLSAYLDLPGGKIPFSYDQRNFIGNGSIGILLLHHHNASGSRAQTFGPSVSLVPIIRSPK